MPSIETSTVQLSFQKFIEPGYTTLSVGSRLERLGVPVLVAAILLGAGLLAAIALCLYHLSGQDGQDST